MKNLYANPPPNTNAKCARQKPKPETWSAAAFELDGEWVGKLPVMFFVEREKLRVVVP
jgi:hypothetical protein